MRQLCNDIAERQQKGIAKYGVTVAENPLELREWLQHAYEETLDKAIYLKRAIAEMENGGGLSGGPSQGGKNDMNEVNAILTTEEGHVRSSRLLAGREAGGQQATGVSSPPPLAGGRCPACGGTGVLLSFGLHTTGEIECRKCRGTGQRSGPANTKLAD